jgi:hypothetical protein
MIKWIVRATYSKRDMYGNCYWAFSLTDGETGKTVSGKVSGGESNIRGIIYELSGGWLNNYYFICNEMKIREFNRYTKNMPYAGCDPKELAKWCLKKLAE